MIHFGGVGGNIVGIDVHSRDGQNQFEFQKQIE
jgi:hypothetical protein